MESTSTTNSILEHIKQYYEIKIKLLKYQGIDKASAIIAEVITALVIVVLSLLAFIMLSISLAFFAGYLLKSNWEGFCCVTLLYVIIGFSAHLLKISIQNKLIGWLFKIVFKK